MIINLALRVAAIFTAARVGLPGNHWVWWLLATAALFAIADWRDVRSRLARERKLRSELQTLRNRTIDAYLKCTCGAYRKDQDNHEAKS